jgi:hypothetical protein
MKNIDKGVKKNHPLGMATSKNRGVGFVVSNLTSGGRQQKHLPLTSRRQRR